MGSGGSVHRGLPRQRRWRKRPHQSRHMKALSGSCSQAGHRYRPEAVLAFPKGASAKRPVPTQSLCSTATAAHPKRSHPRRRVSRLCQSPAEKSWIRGAVPSQPPLHRKKEQYRTPLPPCRHQPARHRAGASPAFAGHRCWRNPRIDAGESRHVGRVARRHGHHVLHAA